MSKEINIKYKQENVTFLIDDEDFQKIKDLKFYVDNSKISKTYYIVYYDKEYKNVKKLHRFLMNCPKGKVVDHINGNGLDNRKENLRICTHRENLYNHKPHKNSKNLHKGVVFYKNKRKPYYSFIHVNGKTRYLGCYINAEEAALAYNQAAIKYFGNYAKLNEVN